MDGTLKFCILGRVLPIFYVHFPTISLLQFLTAMSSNISEPIRYVKKLAHELQVTVMRKGLRDIVSDGTNGTPFMIDLPS